MRCDGRQIVNSRSSIVNARGFTLIELLVVIAIIALLLAALLPALHAARKHARGVVCRAHVGQWGTILALYLEDNEGHFPRDYEALPGLSLVRGLLINGQTDPNAHRRHHSVRTEDIACCPMATRTTGDRAYAANHQGQLYMEVNNGGTFEAWEITRPAPAFRGSYGLNRNVCSPQFEGPGSLGSWFRRSIDVFSLRATDNIPVLLDGVLPNCGVTENTSPPKTEPSGPGGGTCINRHHGTINGLFLDWSVRPIGLKELWTLKWHLQFDIAGPWTRAGGVQAEDWPSWMRKFKDY